VELIVRILQIRRFVALAAFVVVASSSVPARASAADVQAVAGTFSGGAGDWTSTSACAPLCSVTNTIDAGSGASSPGSATVVYTTLGGLLGGLASGASTWRSPAFTWSNATPDHATLSFARKAAVSSLLAVGGSASSRIQLDDLTAGTTTTVVSQGISTAETSFVTRVQLIDPSLLKQSHSYSLLVTTNLSAAALLSNIRVAYDDISLVGTVESAGPGSSGGSGATGGTGAGGGTGGTGGGTGAGASGGTGAATPGGAAAPAALRLSAPRVVRFQRSHTITLRVRAARAGKGVGHLTITVLVATTTRRALTGRDGVATVRVSLRGGGPIRITFRAGGAVATTWVRPRRPVSG
jgi:hypothetical protein